MSYLFIDKIGCELEGGWDARPEHPEGDGSVRVQGAYTGECKAPAYRRFSSVEKYLQKNWPQYVNETCGFHIHLSILNNSAYSRLLEEDFHKDALTFWEQWATAEGISSGHRFWKRFRGQNDFCKTALPLPVMQQATQRGKGRERYYFLNFCHAYHGTFELRLLPSWSKVETAIKSVNAWANFVDTWLHNKSIRSEIAFSAREEIYGIAQEPLVISEDYVTSVTRLDGYRALAVGDRVSVRGIIDGREFEGETGTVREVGLNTAGRYRILVHYDGSANEGPFSWYGLEDENNALHRI